MTTPNTKFLTPGDCSDLANLMMSKYAHYLGGRTFEISAEERDKVVYVKVLMRNSDDSFYYPVEGRMKFEVEDLSAREAALFLVDYVDVYFEEFFEENDEDLYLPIDWADHEYCAVTFQIRGQIMNLKVERMADDLLAKGEKYQGPDIII